MARYPIAEAARRMGVSKASLRSRVQRGSVDAIKDGEGVWQVEVPDVLHALSHGEASTPDDAPALHRDIQRLESEVQFLRDRLTARDRDVERLTQSLLALTMQGHATLSSGPHEGEGEQSTPSTQGDVQRGIQAPRRGILQSVRRWLRNLDVA